MIIYPPLHAGFNLLGIHIHYYSLCIFAAISISLLVLLFLIKKNILSVQIDMILDSAPLLVLSSIIGARAYYVLLSFNSYVREPLSAFMIWKGGISIHGAIIAGIAVGYFYFKKKSLNVLRYFDAFSLVFPLGQAIGRFGNYFNQEAFGVPVSFLCKLKLYVSPQYRPLGYESFDYFAPLFLYEAICDFMIYFILLTVKKKTADNYDGLIFFLYIILYSFVRLCLEYFRLDTVLYLFQIPFPALISFVGLIFGIIGLFFAVKKTSIR